MNRASRPAKAQNGFSRIDLLALVAGVVLLLALTPGALSDFKTQSKLAVCLGNQHQLTAGWLMYADSNGGRLVENVHGGAAMNPDLRMYRAWAYGWLDWSLRPDNTNSLYLTDPKYSVLAPFTLRSPRLFKCPEDAYLNAAQKEIGWTERVRSYSMNSCMGEGNDKAWYGTNQTVYLSLDQIIEPSPSRAFVFIEEHPDSIIGPAFFVNPMAPTWINVPGSYHNLGAVISFADGHVEAHRWENRSEWIRPINYRSTLNLGVPPDDPDWIWLKQRATGPRARNY